ncbi:endolytic transglycosylase MltG [Deltaproteobacteria bacterium]|nr:endolytic transglycosylase MltG [Deltaproteobacteria bacterium]
MFKISGERIAVIITGLLSLAMIVIITGFGLYFVNPAEKGGVDQIIIVQEGMSLKEVAGRLESRGLIRNRTIFTFWTRLMGYGRQVKAGEYLLSSGMAPIKIMEILTRGVIITYSVTIPEGFSIEQVGGMLAEKGLVDKPQFISIAREPQILSKYGIVGPSLEGYLYPDTYQFGRGLSPVSIIDVMIKRFNEVVKPFMKRIEESGMTMEEVVTLASIVEKETGSAEERPLISSIFLNRIKKGMRLESDPTVIYGMDNFAGNLTRKDLSESTPYNTYMIRGLPPGPIANPGLESIKAVLYPSETDYLYFVSKNDGTHYFSRSLEEHNRAVRIYQKKQVVDLDGTL